MQNSKRVPTQVHTRKLDRSVARHNMVKAGMTQLNKDKDGLGSKFAKSWRNYV